MPAIESPAAPETIMIDMTPTWASIMPILIEGVRNGTPTGQKIAIEELMRLAGIVDEINAQAKA